MQYCNLKQITHKHYICVVMHCNFGPFKEIKNRWLATCLVQHLAECCTYFIFVSESSSKCH